VGLVIERARDRVANVYAHEVHQLEGAHAEAGGPAGDPVDLLGRGEPLLDDPQRLERERPVAAVHEEAGSVRGRDHPLAHRLRDGPRPGERRGRARRSGHELDEAHPRHGVEEVQPDHALRPGHGGGDLRDRQGRRVGGQHGVRREHPRERREQLPLDLERLGRRLDHHVAGREAGEGPDPLDARHPVRGRRIGVVNEDAQPGVAGGGGDAGAHRPRAGDPDAQGHASALMPVSARPMMSFWICEVPS
jgi:hypothetical protein